MKGILRSAILITIANTVFGASFVLAATIKVPGNLDYTLQEAIDAAQPGDVLKITVSTLKEKAPIIVDVDDLTIVGKGIHATTIQNNSGRTMLPGKNLSAWIN